jgi:N-acetylmuramoyl-L-alanine amidase
MLEKIHCPSPNFEPRPQGVPLDMIVLHYTDMLNAEEALERLCDPQAKVSAHFLISKEGELYQLVDPKHRAWHAGVSSWEGQGDINSRSIGVELDNLGHTFGPEPFSKVQMKTLLALLEELTQTYGIQPHRIVGHSDVAPGRKKDPGEWFPWHVLAEKGFGFWPQEKMASQHISVVPKMSIEEMQQAFSDIGYECAKTGVWDEESQAVCLAFQRHFTPQDLTGYPTNLVKQTLQGLLKQE